MKCFHDNIEVSFPAVAGGIYVYAKMSAFERILQDFAAGSSTLGVDSQGRRQEYKVVSHGAVTFGRSICLVERMVYTLSLRPYLTLV